MKKIVDVIGQDNSPLTVTYVGHDKYYNIHHILSSEDYVSALWCIP